MKKYLYLPICIVLVLLFIFYLINKSELDKPGSGFHTCNGGICIGTAKECGCN